MNRHNKLEAGFSLVQLGIVLTILAVGAAAMLPEGEKTSPLARNESTYDKMTIIQDALEGFKAANGRLPCPGNGQYAPSEQFFGTEAVGPGNCFTGQLPRANIYNYPGMSVVIGSIPTKTLGLPDDYALDGFGRPFTYIVSVDATDAYSCSKMTAGKVNVLSDAGGTISQTVMAAIISHGKNGIGAFYSQGGTRNATFTPNDASEGENAEPYTGVTYPDGDVVKKEMTPAFDDLVFTEDTCCVGAICQKDRYDGPDLILTGNDPISFALGRAMAYKFDALTETFTLTYTSAVGWTKAASLSGDNSIFPQADNIFSNIYMTRRAKDQFYVYSFVNTAPSGKQPEFSAISSDGNYFAITTLNGPTYAYFYKSTNGYYTKLADAATLPTTTPRNISASRDLKYIAMAQGATAPKIFVYKRDGDTLSYLATPAAMPGCTVDHVSISDDSTYMAAVCSDAPGLFIYKRSGDVFDDAAAPDPVSVPPSGSMTAFSHDSNLLVIGSNEDPVFLRAYYRTAGTDTFTFIATSPFGAAANQPQAQANEACFSRDNKYLAVGHKTDTDIHNPVSIYRVNGTGASTTFTKLANPSTIPKHESYQCTFRW